MSFEAQLVLKTEEPIPFIIADSGSVTKGSVMKLTDPMTVALTAGAIDTFGGILWGDKISSDGVVRAAVYRGGIFKVYLSGSCTVGDPATTDALPNMFKSTIAIANASLSGTKIWGTFLETGTSGETVLMELRPHCLASSA